MKKQNFLDTAGNYLCTIGMSGEKIYISLLPFVGSVLVLLLFHSLWGTVSGFVLDKMTALKMGKSIIDQAEFFVRCVGYAWAVAAVLMFWQRERGSVNAMQNTVSAVYYLSIAFSVVGKVALDILDHNIEKKPLSIVLYVVTTVLFLVVICVAGVLATLFCAPQAIALALMVGIPLNLAVIYFRSQKIAQTQCWKDTLECMEQNSMEDEVFEVQLTDSGVYFVNPENRVISCVSFASRDYPNLNYWARKVYIAMIMQHLPKGYEAESLNNMFVAENIALKTRLHRDETIRRRSNHKENKRRRSEGKSW